MTPIDALRALLSRGVVRLDTRNVPAEVTVWPEHGEARRFYGANIEDRNDAGFDGDTPTSWPMDTDVEHDEADTGYQGAPVRVRTRNRKGSDPLEWPIDLRIREMPPCR